MGRMYSDPEVQKLVKDMPYSIVEGNNGMACVEVDGKVYTPQEISAKVLAKLKADELLKHIPVVMLTVLSDTGTVSEATKLGATGFLIKSEIDPKELTNKVDTYLMNKK